jgi:hypothetical protein
MPVLGYDRMAVLRQWSKEQQMEVRPPRLPRLVVWWLRKHSELAVI